MGRVCNKYWKTFVITFVLFDAGSCEVIVYRIKSSFAIPSSRLLIELMEYATKISAEKIETWRLTLNWTRAAEADHGDQGLPAEGAQEGRQVGQDQEERREHQVQGALLALPLHLGHYRQGEGREAQAVAAPRYATIPLHLPINLWCLVLESSNQNLFKRIWIWFYHLDKLICMGLQWWKLIGFFNPWIPNLLYTK